MTEDENDKSSTFAATVSIECWKRQRFHDITHLSTTTHWKCCDTMPNSIIECHFVWASVRSLRVWLKFTSRNNRMAHEIKMTKRYRTRLHDFVFTIVSLTLTTSWFASKHSNAQIRWIEILLLFPCMWFWAEYWVRNLNWINWTKSGTDANGLLCEAAFGI